jgi:hypothetical protein
VRYFESLVLVCAQQIGNEAAGFIGGGTKRRKARVTSAPMAGSMNSTASAARAT